MSRLRSSEHVRMDNYSDEDLYDIFGARAKRGLEEGVVTDEQLYRIADAAAGDARLAIGMLRSTAGKPIVRIASGSPTTSASMRPKTPAPGSSNGVSTRLLHTSRSSTDKQGECLGA
nr:hypothetical protein [Natronococcus pandeyae]